MNSTNPTLIIVAGIFILGILILYFLPVGHWFRATVSGVRISFMELLLMRLRRSPVREIVEAMIVCAKGGVLISRDQLEAHALAGGNVKNVAFGLVAAKQAGLELSIQKATAADFKGVNLVEAVKTKTAKRKYDEKLFE